MVDYREILRLHSLGNSQRSISLIVQSSRNTVANVITAAKAAKISWPLDDDVTNVQLQGIMFPEKFSQNVLYTLPDFSWIHRELAQKGVTLTLLWTEYCIKVRNEGGIPYMYTQFCDKYRHWAQISKATMRINHKPGDAIQVDWAGKSIPFTDSVTGEEKPAYVFVAVLPCSWYTYAEACYNEQSENWLLCHVHAFNYFGGVARLLIPDNTKTATIHNNRYETILNKSYHEMADYYDTAIVPARVKAPDDKSAAEGSVKYVSTWITAALRNQKFFSLAEINEEINIKLKELNERPFEERPGNRKTAFEKEEKDYLKPLPLSPYEPALWVTLKVGRDYLITDQINKYSVPYDLIGEKVDVRISKNTVEVFFRGTRVATHIRIKSPQIDPIVKTEHMPEAHRQYLTYNQNDFEKWADTVGVNTRRVVDYFLHQGKEVEQGYKPCASLRNLDKTYGPKKLEDACKRLLALSSSPTIRNIKLMIKMPSVSLESTKNKPVINKGETSSHGITRGAAYYNRGGNSNE